MAGAGIRAEKGDTTSLEKLLSHKKVNVRQPIDGARCGEPAPPNDDDLKRISLANELGYAMLSHRG